LIKENDLTIVASGSEWLIGSAKPISNAMIDLIEHANKSIGMTIAYLYPGSLVTGGVWDSLEKAANNGVNIYFIVNDFDNQIAKDKLKRIRDQNPRNVAIKNFVDNGALLHAKVIVTDRENVIISSSNHSEGGYSNNHELGIKLSGKTASEVSKMFYTLWDSKKCHDIK
jgi:phosphatidylserine/phosphatidylglycerophosphate/cardiolipin synthase-like enzyme